MFALPLDRSSSLPLFLSKPQACPYMPGAIERKLFTRLSGDLEQDLETNAVLMQAGFRRSHDIVYRPACPSCFACVPVRIPVRAFRVSLSFRRIMARNKALILTNAGVVLTQDHYDLFKFYQSCRHAESDMVHMSPEEFTAMITEGATDTLVYELRAPEEKESGGLLMGGILIDRAQNGLSAVYSYFRPDEPRRSLGTYLILKVIQEAQRQGLSYVYLGYCITGVRKMAYKARFRPLETFGLGGWKAVR